MSDLDLEWDLEWDLELDNIGKAWTVRSPSLSWPCVMVVIMLRCNFLCVIIITPGVPSPHPPVPPLTSLVFPALQSPHGLLSFYIPTLHASRSIFYGWLCTEVKVIQKPILVSTYYLRPVSCEDMDDDPCLPCIQVFTYVSFFLGVVYLYSYTDEFLHEDQHLEVR